MKMRLEFGKKGTEGLKGDGVDETDGWASLGQYGEGNNDYDWSSLESELEGWDFLQDEPHARDKGNPFSVEEIEKTLREINDGVFEQSTENQESTLQESEPTSWDSLKNEPFAGEKKDPSKDDQEDDIARKIRELKESLPRAFRRGSEEPTSPAPQYGQVAPREPQIESVTDPDNYDRNNSETAQTPQPENADNPNTDAEAESNESEMTKTIDFESLPDEAKQRITERLKNNRFGVQFDRIGKIYQEGNLVAVDAVDEHGNFVVGVDYTLEDFEKLINESSQE